MKFVAHLVDPTGVTISLVVVVVVILVFSWPVEGPEPGQMAVVRLHFVRLDWLGRFI